MRRLALVVAALALVGCASGVRGPRRARAPTEPAPCLRVCSTVGCGSGFVVGRRVITAWHVVGEAHGGGVVSGGGVVVPLDFRQIGHGDVCEADAPDPVPASWAVYTLAEPVNGETVDSLGYVAGTLTHYRGPIIGDVPWFPGEGRYLSVDSTVEHGMSGGPVLNQRGDVVAIVTNRLLGRLIVLDVP